MLLKSLHKACECYYLACDQGALVTFLNEGQIRCFREDILLGDKNVGSVLKVCWNIKGLLDARILFLNQARAGHAPGFLKLNLC